MKRVPANQGFTLAEILLGGMVLTIAIAAILGAYVGQVTLNEHSRNLSLAIQDANRIIERIRQQNADCGAAATPQIIPPGVTRWDLWLTPKSMPAVNNELIVVTCQNSGATQYCPAGQMGGEWHAAGAAGTADPLRVTVAVCWRHRGRVIGECSGTPLQADVTVTVPNDDASIIESPAMLTTLVTCRG